MKKVDTGFLSVLIILLIFSLSACENGLIEQVESARAAAVMPVLTTDAITSISTTTATGGGNITDDGGIPVTARGLCWGTAPNPTINDNFSINSGVEQGAYSDLMTGLSPGTLYYVRAYATNSETTGYGSQVSFTTLPGETALISVSPVGYPAGSGKLDVSWDAVSGTNIYYDVYYSTSSTLPGTANGPTDLSGTSCQLEGLTNYQTYYVWVVAKNATGESSPAGSDACMVGVKVSAISFNETSGTFLPGYSETLIVTIAPENATQPNLIWETSDSGLATVSDATITGGTSLGTATITATAPDGYGASATFSASNVVYAIDGVSAGGIVFYDKGGYSDGWRYLEAAPSMWDGSSDDPAVPWITGGTAQATANGNTATEIGTGLANSLSIIAQTGHTESAAAVCRAYAGGGKTDWFLPSKETLHLMYLENASIGLDGVYWSSSEADAANAYTKTIFSGFESGSYGKGVPDGAFDYRVRPIRAF